MPRVSFIIPVYNAEKSLSKCLDSLVSLSFNDWEAIIVDDGSKDTSAAICDGYAVKDCRFKVFHKCNGGVSSARNFGLKKASGEYLTFVDSDDFVNEDYLSFFCDGEVKEDVVFSSYRLVDGEEKNKIPFGTTLCDRSEVVDFVSKYMYSKHIMAPWGKFFRQEVVFERGFDESLRRGEDTKFCLLTLNKCQSLRTVGESVYYYDLPLSEAKYKMNFAEATSHLNSIFQAYEETDFRSEVFENGVFGIFMNSAVDDILRHPFTFFFDKTVKRCAGVGGKSSFKVRLTYLFYNNIIRATLSRLLKR